MLNPIDTTTDSTEAMFRRLQSLEERADSLELGKGSEFSYVNFDTPSLIAFLEQRSQDPLGTVIMCRHEYGEEFEGKIQGEIFIKWEPGSY